MHYMYNKMFLILNKNRYRQGRIKVFVGPGHSHNLRHSIHKYFHLYTTHNRSHNMSIVHISVLSYFVCPESQVLHAEASYNMPNWLRSI
jgi:hypothetical protein